MTGELSRTAAAIAWVENGAGPDEPARTAYRAALMFGVSQAAISQERKRRRLRRPMFAAVVAGEHAADPRWPAPTPELGKKPGITFREIPADP